MDSGVLRIGIVGAGRIARERHLPGFAAIPGVKVVGVCNLHRESSIKIARDFDIPKIYDTWEYLVEDESIDAVVIAAWPYMHGPVTLAALGAGKHVLTQARMAMNAREAQRMLDRSREFPHLTAMIVPSPYGLTGDAYMRELIEDGFLGTLRELRVRGLSDGLADPKTPLGWRQITKYSGFNMLNLGILHETALRWTAPATRVLARASKLVPIRRDSETGRKTRVGTPDTVQALTTQADGSIGVYDLSGVVRHETEMSISLFGSAGTLVYDLARDQIRGAVSTEREPRVLAIPEDGRSGWNVEADFIAAIRGERPVTRTDFLTGVRYMHFTEAVARSSRHEQPVDLPLKEFSNPSL